MVSIKHQKIVVNNYEITGVINELEARRIEALLRSMKGVISAKISTELSNLELVTKKRMETVLVNDRLALIGAYCLVNYFVLNGVKSYPK